MGFLGLGYEIVLQGGARPEVMTAMISLIATAGALKVDETRKNNNSTPPATPPTPEAPPQGTRRVVAYVDEKGNIVKTEEEG